VTVVGDVHIYPVIEQEGPMFDFRGFSPTLTDDVLEKHRAWLQPSFLDPQSGLQLSKLW
jgi:hypothetical protein